jgi:hypothetical protein
LGEKKIIREPHDVTRTERPRGPSYGGFEAIEAAAKLQPDFILMGHQPMFLWILMALLRRQTNGTISLISRKLPKSPSAIKKKRQVGDRCPCTSLTAVTGSHRQRPVFVGLFAV